MAALNPLRFMMVETIFNITDDTQPGDAVSEVLRVTCAICETSIIFTETDEEPLTLDDIVTIMTHHWVQTHPHPKRPKSFL